MGEPTLQQLRYLVALHEHQHFGRAAAACYVSQPALSSQIRELERRLGALLLERTRSGLLFTAAGIDAVTRARRILGDVDDLVEAAGAATGALTSIDVGTIPTIGPYLLPRAIPVLTNHFPGAALHLHERTTAELVDELRGGGVDVVLLGTQERDSDLTTVVLGHDPFLVALPAHHRLATRRGPVSADELATLPVLVLAEGHCLRDQALDVCTGVGVTGAEVVATSLATVVQMVAAGMGVTLLPASAAALEARPGNGIVVKRLRAPETGRAITLNWRRSSPHAARFTELASLLKRALQLK
jgi:LysR family hydrogen peroxide-inducible transcriptional activator